MLALLLGIAVLAATLLIVGLIMGFTWFLSDEIHSMPLGLLVIFVGLFLSVAALLAGGSLAYWLFTP